MGAKRTEDGRKHRVEILDFVQKYREANGCGPTRAIMLEELAPMSVGSLMHHIDQLVIQGFIRYEQGSFRTMRLTRKQRKFLE